MIILPCTSLCLDLGSMMKEKKEMLTVINDKEHMHPFFGTKLKQHKGFFNYLITTEAHLFPYPATCEPLFWNYRNKIIKNFNAEASLDFRMEGYECGMNNPPTDKECDKVQKKQANLDEVKENLLSCLKK